MALKVGQGDLNPQSQLEPWSQIKRLLTAETRPWLASIKAFPNTYKHAICACIYNEHAFLHTCSAEYDRLTVQ